MMNLRGWLRLGVSHQYFLNGRDLHIDEKTVVLSLLFGVPNVRNTHEIPEQVTFKTGPVYAISADPPV